MANRIEPADVTPCEAGPQRRSGADRFRSERICHRVAGAIQAADGLPMLVEHLSERIRPGPALGAEKTYRHGKRIERRPFDRSEAGVRADARIAIAARVPAWA